jgi:hypothetical protein
LSGTFTGLGIDALVGIADGKDGRAIEVLHEQIAIDPSFMPAHYCLICIYLLQGKLPEVLTELETLRRLDRSGTGALGLFGLTYARAGQTADAQKILGQMQELQQKEIDQRVGIAGVEHALSNDAHALDSLEKAVEEHAYGLETLNVDPEWKELRPNPRFRGILKRINLAK